jgi:hypothetical protein
MESEGMPVTSPTGRVVDDRPEGVRSGRYPAKFPNSDNDASNQRQPPYYCGNYGCDRGVIWMMSEFPVPCQDCQKLREAMKNGK